MFGRRTIIISLSLLRSALTYIYAAAQGPPFDATSALMSIGNGKYLVNPSLAVSIVITTGGSFEPQVLGCTKKQDTLLV